MNVLILNGSPRKNGNVAKLLNAVREGAEKKHTVKWIDVYNLNILPCRGCMRCRKEDNCVLAPDDAHNIAKDIAEADVLVVGTPTYWANMSSMLKLLFDRIVYILMGEKSNGFPIPKQKGKKAIIIAACTTPYPFNIIAKQSTGAIAAVWEVLKYAGYKLIGKINLAGTVKCPNVSDKMLAKAKKLGEKI